MDHAIEKFCTIIFEARKGDNRHALRYTPAGDDSVPLKEDRLVLAKVDGNGKWVVVGVLVESQKAKPGEKILFGRDEDGKVTSLLKMLNDGTIDLSNEKDFKRTTKGDTTITDEGNRTETIKKDEAHTTEGKLTLTVKGNMTFETDGAVTHKGKKDVTQEATGKYSIKGTTVEITGDTAVILKTIGSGVWCPNGTTSCYICGAPHGGPAMGIVGLKGS
jgi:hypothetical protein